MRWFGLALLGILIAAAVSVAASRLASQQIGLASQPISAGDALAPAAAKKPLHQAHHRRPANHTSPQTTSPQTAPNAPAPEPETTEPQPTEPAPLPAEPHSGSGESDHPGGESADD